MIDTAAKSEERVKSNPGAEPIPDDTQFLGVRSDRSSLARARFLVLPVPYERTTSYKKGTERGPAKFLEASLQVELWDEELKDDTWQAGIHTFPLWVTDENAPAFFPKLRRKAEECARLKGKTLFVIGGEHSLSQATIPAFAGAYPKLSVLHFDAHADLRSEYEGNPHSHACALYPASKLCKLVQVGIRSAGPEELPNMRTPRVRTFFMHEWPDPKKLAAQVIRELTPDVYISLDLDGFDPAVIPGVGTPQPGGFGWYDGLEILKAVCRRKNVVGVDVMELCPLLDDVRSELAAAKLVYRLMGHIAARGR